MKVAVVGLGVEGINAVNSLLNHGHQVYASDINAKIVLNQNENLDVDLGFHNFDKINDADAVVLSPGLWNHKSFQKYKSEKKLLTDILTQNKPKFTIAVTGTNGKTTTTMMIAGILKQAGLKVITGGNAGGGFKGYTEIILEASSEKYDAILVEVCDMTLDFCKHSFDFDVVVITNIGRDHMEVHQSMGNYLKSIENFIYGKKVVFDPDNETFAKIGMGAKESYFFSNIPYPLKLFGNFNIKNAGAASKTAEIIGIPPETIEKSLKEFTAPPGRSTIINLPHARIVVGKTDNTDATTAVLDETEFPVIILGTPRKGELCRLEVFREVSKTNSEIIAVFPGLDNTCEDAENILKNANYQGDIVNLSDVDEVVEFALKCSEKYSNVFIGGNGQQKIIQITESLKEAISAN